MSGKRVLLEHRLHVGVEAVEALAHVHRLKSHKQARGRRKAQHRQPRSNPASSCTESVSRKRTVKPSQLTSSIAQGVTAELTGGGASRTSLNIIGTGSFEARLVFVSHQFNVEMGTPCCFEKALRVSPLRLNCSTMCIRCA